MAHSANVHAMLRITVCGFQLTDDLSASAADNFLQPSVAQRLRVSYPWRVLLENRDYLVASQLRVAVTVQPAQRERVAPYDSPGGDLDLLQEVLAAGFAP